jgi:hypothetical protein
MFSTWKAVASRGRDEMTISRSSLRIRCTQSMVVLALLAGSTVKTWFVLVLEVASLVRAQTSERGRDRRRLQTDGRNGVEIHGIRHDALPNAAGGLRRPEDTRPSHFRIASCWVRGASSTPSVGWQRSRFATRVRCKVRDRQTLAERWRGTTRGRCGSWKPSPASPRLRPFGRPARKSAGRTEDAYFGSSMTGSGRIPCKCCDGRCWARTSDLRLVEAALSQLS